MLNIIYLECIKTFAKKRTYLGMLIVAVTVPIVTTAMYIEGGRFLGRAMRSLQQDFFFVGNLYNGWFVLQQLMNALWVHIPLLITFVAGDMLAGEATAGTYRLILTRPVSRVKIFLSKYTVTLIYTTLFIFFTAAIGIGLSLAQFGSGDILVLRYGVLILPESEAPLRFGLAFLGALVAMITVSSLAFFFSSFVENAIGPIIGTMGAMLIASLITALPLEVFESLRPYLFTTYLNIWMLPLQEPIPWMKMGASAAWLLGYAAAFVIGALGIFVRKDILS